MTQLRLVYSTFNNETKNLRLPSGKLKMSRVSCSTLPPLALKIMKLQDRDPKLALVIERLVDDALRRKAG